MINNKKALFVLTSLILLLMFPVKKTVAEETGFVLQVNITGGNSEYIVEIEDDPYYAEKKPTVFVNTDIVGSVAKVVDENKTEIENTLVNGEVSFKVDKGGTYYITKVPSRASTPAYVIPKTGVE